MSEHDDQARYSKFLHQREIKADCVACGENRVFSSIGGDPVQGIVYFACKAEGCKHRMELHIDP